MSLTPLLNHLQTLFSPKTNSLLTTLLPPTVFAAIFIPLISKCYTNYTIWHSLGRGGVPYNFFGWAVQGIIGLFLSNDLLSTKVYEDPRSIKEYGPNSNKRFLVGELERRSGEAPIVPFTVAPQRQLGRGSEAPLRELQKKLISDIVASNPQTISLKTSALEKIGPAIFLNSHIPLPSGTDHTNREIAHIHLDAEGSSHVTLSLRDAKEVIEKGWGRRHKLSGKWIPVTYLLIYAPRSEDEVEILGRILRAGVAFMSGEEVA